MQESKVYTIGFTQKTAEEFFMLLQDYGVKTILDTRINNKSQLAWFTKYPDLEFFLKQFWINYIYEPLFAPTQELLSAYRKNEINWNQYEIIYNKIISERNVEKIMEKYPINWTCLLCSEATPEFCHRRLLVEYLQKHMNKKMKIIHI